MIRWLGKVFIWLLTLFFLIALPFVALVRGATWAYQAYDLPSYPSLGLGAVMSSAVVVVYFVLIYGIFLGWKKLSRRSLIIKASLAVLLIGAYCGHALFFFSAKQAKSPEVYEEFAGLHPLLRVGMGTIVLLDQGMVVTDFSRTKADYSKMGLKTLKNSLHYEQADGYVHAMDLRTNDRQEWRNQLLEAYFSLMGFNTLRHVGTADHLHVSLSPHDYPNAL